MSELYDAIKRIQELEKEVQALTKRAEHAESTARMLRANNKDLKKQQVSYQAFTSQTSIVIPRRAIEDNDYTDYAMSELEHRAIRDLGKMILDNRQYVKHKLTTENNPIDLTVKYTYTSTFMLASQPSK